MSNGILISGSTPPEAGTVKAIYEAVAGIIQVAHDCHMDQATTQLALRILQDASHTEGAHHVNISGSSISMPSTIVNEAQFEDDEEADFLADDEEAER